MTIDSIPHSTPSAAHRTPRPYKMTPFQMHKWMRAQTVKTQSGSSTTYCLEWTGSLSNKGYGIVFWQGKSVLAHRLMYALEKGIPYAGIPIKTSVLHKCKNRGCVRSSHLEVGTQKYNNEAALAANKDRVANGTHFLLGSSHPLAKLTEADIPVIRARLAKGDNQKDIAQDYGVSHPAISGVKTGRTWRHIKACAQGVA